MGCRKREFEGIPLKDDKMAKLIERNEIILIGPVGAGKSTLGKLLSKALHLPQCSMDEYRWNYYNEIGYDDAFAKELGKKEGFWALYMYWKEFECYAVERLLSEHHDCVIDFGAGHAVYENGNHLDRAKKAMEPFQNVVLILPSADTAESISTLNKRNGDEENPNRMSINAHFVKHPSIRDLAKLTVYTHGKTPDETRDEILSTVKLKV